MQRDQKYFPPDSVPPSLPNQVGGCYAYNSNLSSFFNGAILPPSLKHLPSFQNVDFRPSNFCPRNFIIFDQTVDRSQIMYHPEIFPKCQNLGLDFGAAYPVGNMKLNEANVEGENSYLKEDSDDIDALLSSEEEEEEYVDEEVSTARTYRDYGIDSADSCSSRARKSRLSSSFSQKLSGSSNSISGKKRQEIRKMMKALRGIVPNGNQMNTAALLDEAVKYLKSLKVEVQKFGPGNF